MATPGKIDGVARRPLVSVVDADEAVCNALSSFIRSIGMRCAHFYSAETFLSSGPLAETDFLVLDVELPGLGGLDLQRRLTDLKYTIPTAFMTRSPSAALREKARDHGAVALLIKPFTASAVLKAIRSSLDRRRSASAGG
jgi:FixJ family two-component response regulator